MTVICGNRRSEVIVERSSSITHGDISAGANLASVPHTNGLHCCASIETAGAPSNGLATRNETLLVVDDDEDFASPLAEALDISGYGPKFSR